MRLRSLVSLPMMFVVVLTGCGRGEPTGGGTDPGPIDVGATAPAFSLPAASGGEISLSRYKGSPVLLYFSMGPG